MQSFSQHQVVDNLDALLELVKQGEEIEITIDGKPIVRLVPVSVADAAGVDSDVPTDEVEQAFYGD